MTSLIARCCLRSRSVPISKFRPEATFAGTTVCDVRHPWGWTQQFQPIEAQTFRFSCDVA
jgi:hypothetical protein